MRWGMTAQDNHRLRDATAIFGRGAGMICLCGQSGFIGGRRRRVPSSRTFPSFPAA